MHTLCLASSDSGPVLPQLRLKCRKVSAREGTRAQHPPYILVSGLIRISGLSALSRTKRRMDSLLIRHPFIPTLGPIISPFAKDLSSRWQTLFLLATRRRHTCSTRITPSRNFNDPHDTKIDRSHRRLERPDLCRRYARHFVARHDGVLLGMCMKKGEADF